MTRRLLESSLVQIYFDGQEASVLAVVRRADSHSKDRPKRIRRGTIDVVQVLFVSVDAQGLRREGQMSPS